MAEQEFEFGSADAQAEDAMAAVMNVDFNLEDEYKLAPLVPQGNYQGNVTNVSIDAKGHAILWQVTLDGNGGYQSDGETPIDGQVMFYRAWLPKSGDDSEMIKSGGMTKRQWKINALSDFSKGMGIDMSTPAVIKEAIENSDWIGIRVNMAVTFDEYQGVVRNQVNKMKKVD